MPLMPVMRVSCPYLHWSFPVSPQRVDVGGIDDVPELERVVQSAGVQHVIALQQQRAHQPAVSAQHLLAVRAVHDRAGRGRRAAGRLGAHRRPDAAVPDADQPLSPRGDHVVAVVADLHGEDFAAVAVELAAFGAVFALAFALEDRGHFPRFHVPEARLAVLAAAYDVLFVAGDVGAGDRHLESERRGMRTRWPLQKRPSGRSASISWFATSLKMRPRACTELLLKALLPRLLVGDASQFALPLLHRLLHRFQKLPPPLDALC